MVKRLILGFLIAVSCVISACSPKPATVEVTPTTETVEETITLENLGE